MLQPSELADNDETVNKIELDFREAVDTVPRRGRLRQARASGAEQESHFWSDSARRRKRKAAVRFDGVLRHATLQPQRCRDRRRDPMGFVLRRLLRLAGGFIVSVQRGGILHATLRRRVLLEGSNSGSKKSIGLLVYRKKNPLHVRSLLIRRTNSISMFPVCSVLYKAGRFPGQGDAVGLGPLASRDPGKVHHGPAMQVHNSASPPVTKDERYRSESLPRAGMLWTWTTGFLLLLRKSVFETAPLGSGRLLLLRHFE